MPPALSGFYRLTYESSARLPEAAEARIAALDAILRVSRKRNILCGISGVLLFNSKTFCQILEGVEPEVERLFRRIQADPRHADVRILERKTAPNRIFHCWSMAYLEVKPDLSLSDCIAQDLPPILLQKKILATHPIQPADHLFGSVVTIG